MLFYLTNVNVVDEMYEGVEDMGIIIPISIDIYLRNFPSSKLSIENFSIIFSSPMCMAIFPLSIMDVAEYDMNMTAYEKMREKELWQDVIFTILNFPQYSEQKKYMGHILSSLLLYDDIFDDIFKMKLGLDLGKKYCIRFSSMAHVFTPWIYF